MNKKVYGILGLTDCDNVEAIVERMDCSNCEKMIEEIKSTGFLITDELMDTLLFSNGRVFGPLLSHITEKVWINLMNVVLNCTKDENTRLRKKFNRIFNLMDDIEYKYGDSYPKKTLVYVREGEKIKSFSCQDNPCVIYCAR